jgi:hypothetical protein
MSPTFLDRLLLKHCSHEFSWPRRSPTGECYQVCLLCGDEYAYDWTSMRRTVRVAKAETEARKTPQNKLGWLPRARRLSIPIPLHYRAAETSRWYEGEIRNISESGISLRGERIWPAKTAMEMLFQMPVQISGKKNSQVICNGTVARAEATGNGEAFPALAIAILDYKFLHDESGQMSSALMPTQSRVKQERLPVASLFRKKACRSQRQG